MINEKLCVMEPCLWLERFLPLVGLEPGTARSVGQPTELPRLLTKCKLLFIFNIFLHI